MTKLLLMIVVLLASLTLRSQAARISTTRHPSRSDRLATRSRGLLRDVPRSASGARVLPLLRRLGLVVPLLCLRPALSFSHLRLGEPSASADPASRGRRPLCIGIAGASGSGKSTMVKEIICRVGSDSVVSVTQDSFYKNLSPSEHEQAKLQEYNFDHPSAFDIEQQRRVLNRFRSGATLIRIPRYDFVSNSRFAPEHDEVFFAPKVLVFEGILALHDEATRSNFDLKMFVEADSDIRLSRRILRDMKSRGRTLASILAQYERFVKPATEKFVLPTREYADIIVPRGVQNTVAIDMVVRYIKDRLENPGGGPKVLLRGSNTKRHVLPVLRGQ